MIGHRGIWQLLCTATCAAKNPAQTEEPREWCMGSQLAMAMPICGFSYHIAGVYDCNRILSLVFSMLLSKPEDYKSAI